MEMNCKQVIRELSNYIDNDLDQALHLQIAEHLLFCPDCTAIHDGLRNTVRLMADVRPFELPAGFRQRLRLRLTGK